MIEVQVNKWKKLHHKCTVLDSTIIKTTFVNCWKVNTQCQVHVLGNDDVFLKQLLSLHKNNDSNEEVSSKNVTRWVPVASTMPVYVTIMEQTKKNDTNSFENTSNNSRHVSETPFFSMERNRKGIKILKVSSGNISLLSSSHNFDNNRLDDYDHDNNQEDDILHFMFVDKTKRHEMFAKWLIETYGVEFLSSGSGVLDVAGGKGELCDSLVALTKDNNPISTILLDPNPRIESSTTTISKVIPEPLSNENIPTLLQHSQYGSWIRNCSILVGMHPDQATEAIIDLASVGIHKPFAVVPCCVMPKLFPNRKYPTTKQGSESSTVRSYNRFCDYLLQKGDFHQHNLSFIGRNKVIYSLPK